jgi:GDP-mannose transporter
VTFGSVSAIFIGFIAGLVYAVAKVKSSSSGSSGLPFTRPTMSASAQSARDANS